MWHLSPWYHAVFGTCQSQGVTPHYFSSTYLSVAHVPLLGSGTALLGDVLMVCHGPFRLCYNNLVCIVSSSPYQSAAATVVVRTNLKVPSHCFRGIFLSVLHPVTRENDKREKVHEHDTTLAGS